MTAASARAMGLLNGDFLPSASASAGSSPGAYGGGGGGRDGNPSSANGLPDGCSVAHGVWAPAITSSCGAGASASDFALLRPLRFTDIGPFGASHACCARHVWACIGRQPGVP